MFGQLTSGLEAAWNKLKGEDVLTKENIVEPLRDISRALLEADVQKKLQMRIEAQGKYLRAILEKAQKSLSSDGNSLGSLEATRAQLTGFNLALSGLMEIMNEAGEARHGDLGKSILPDNYAKTQHLVLQLYQGEQEQENKEVKNEVQDESTLFDLNVKGSHELFGTKGSDFGTKKIKKSRMRFKPLCLINRIMPLPWCHVGEKQCYTIDQTCTVSESPSVQDMGAPLSGNRPYFSDLSACE